MIPRVGSANHIEMVHRPGEAHLAQKLLGLLGCKPARMDIPFLGASYRFSSDGNLWVSEVPRAQWAFEGWLERQTKACGRAEHEAFRAEAEATPQKSSHFGIGVSTLAEWEEIVARLAHAAVHDPELRGRIRLALVARPGEEGSVARLSGGKMMRTVYQAFLRTDILSTGFLALGQCIEIQHSRENDPAYAGELGDGAQVDREPGVAASVRGGA